MRRLKVANPVLRVTKTFRGDEAPSIAASPQASPIGTWSRRSPHPVILCVDDEKNALNVRGQVLEQAGYIVLSATTANQALELFRQSKVDLVLTDHLHPRDGLGTDLMKSLRLLRPEVPIAIYSGAFEIPEDAHEADAFISKTIGPTQMLFEVAKLLKL